jgi:glycosyltransferase involved in cell wall biosynthesis
MKVVIINEGIAYPPVGGNWLRTLNLMLPLANRHEITYVSRGAKDPAASRRARSFYAEHGIRALISDDYPTEKRGLSFYARLGLNLLSPLPYSVASHRSPSVRREVQRLAAEDHIDLFQFEALSYGDIPLDQSARTIVMAHNVESLIWQRYYETESQPHRRWYIGQQWRKYERYERRVLNGATRVVAVSEEDAALMRERFGVENVVVVDNGVDVAHYGALADRRNADPRQILFLGSLDWRPNLDSIERLLTSILPAVIAAEPGARLCVVGRNPPANLVRRLRDHPHAELHANVPDVRPYLARAGVLAVPLRIGGGSRLKILEAIAAGLPVVSTRVGAEGLIFTPNRDLAVVDTEEGMANALVNSMRDPERGAAMARCAKAALESHYDWQRLADRLEAVWYECVNAPEKTPSYSS